MSAALTKAAAWQAAKNWRRIGYESDAPCEHGHMGCSTDGKDGGICMDEAYSLLESEGIDPEDA